LSPASSSSTHPFECPLCKKKYKWKVSVTRHLREECGKTPQHHCTQCNKRFKQRCSFQRHMLTQHHQDERVYRSGRRYPDPKSEVRAAAIERSGLLPLVEAAVRQEIRAEGPVSDAVVPAANPNPIATNPSATNLSATNLSVTNLSSTTIPTTNLSTTVTLPATTTKVDAHSAWVHQQHVSTIQSPQTTSVVQQSSGGTKNLKRGTFQTSSHTQLQLETAISELKSFSEHKSISELK
ncbi:hypothetical protein QAD02_022639, partial [Eretmocerus hayati]